MRRSNWRGALYAAVQTGFDKITWSAVVMQNRVRCYEVEATRHGDTWVLATACDLPLNDSDVERLLQQK